MKEPFSEEMLSAYLDREMTDAERAEFERWLEQSPEVQEKLADFRRLSQLFGELPRSEVPQEFPTQVLQLAERQMLLAEAPSVPRIETAPVGAGRRIQRRILKI